ncbi:MAG TPA: RteC domain-containing protein [Bacteroidales bacterium]|nr:RteC domain-containing protein [Bacteroidales bacterium]
MSDHICNICQNLDDDLKTIESEFSNILKISERSIVCISACLKELKDFVSQNKFPNQEAEILFFKETKPAIYSKLIYFIKIFNIESKRPNGSDESQKRYLQNELNKLEKFFAENLEFYQYMRNKLVYLDDKYFVRGKYDLHLYLDTFYFDADPAFSTSHDFKVAKILANDLLCVYLKTELALIDRKEFKRTDQVRKSKYAWTDPKIALVELIYALQACNSINNGLIDIKEIALFVEAVFDIDLGDFYRTYLEIKQRQNPSKFLDALKTALLKKIEQDDEHPR